MQDTPSQPAKCWDEQGFVAVAVPVTRLVGWGHPVHETAVQKERDGSRERNWRLPRLVCAEKKIRVGPDGNGGCCSCG